MTYADDMLCSECGAPMVLNADGTSNHVRGRGIGVDHDLDADHVASPDCSHPDDRVMAYTEDGTRFYACRDCGAIWEPATPR